MHKRILVLLFIPLVLWACEQSPTTTPEAAALDHADLMAQAAEGNRLVRTTWPSPTDPGMPFYSRIDPTAPHVDTDGEWVAIAFYRDPACIPSEFNLLDFFHVPMAFGCPLTVNGFSLWQGAAFAGAPRVVQIQGNGQVPVWFVPAEAIFAALADEMLTIGELEGLDGLLKGSAHRFTEVIHPHENPPQLSGGGGHPNPKLIQTARGVLEDGRSFQHRLVRQENQSPVVLIRFN